MPEQRALPPDSPLPYGIDERHLMVRDRSARPLLLILVLGLPLVAALLGFLGGGTPAAQTASTSAARLTVETPRVLRSGNWFETQIVAEPAADIADLTIAIDEPLLRRMSIDTQVPDAEKAKVADGKFIYSFGPVPRGERFLLKLDGQIQPFGLRRLEGSVTLRDGDRPLVSLPVSVLVLP